MGERASAHQSPRVRAPYQSLRKGKKHRTRTHERGSGIMPAPVPMNGFEKCEPIDSEIAIEVAGRVHDQGNSDQDDPNGGAGESDPGPVRRRLRTDHVEAPAIAVSWTMERFNSLARYSRPFLTWMWSQGKTSSTGRSRWL